MPLLASTLLVALFTPEPATPVRPPEAGPRVFGDARRIAQVGNRRARLLDDVDPNGDIVDIAHSTDWRRPFYLEFKGLELLGAEPDEGAAFEVDEHLADLGCDPGVYRVAVDHSLGEDTAILAVLEDVVLVEFKGQLGYLATRDAEIPGWRMIWLAPWRIIRRRDTGVSSSTVPQRRSRRRYPSRRRR